MTKIGVCVAMLMVGTLADVQRLPDALTCGIQLICRFHLCLLRSKRRMLTGSVVSLE
jgi:hypothetical protein